MDIEEPFIYLGLIFKQILRLSVIRHLYVLGDFGGL